MNDQHKFKVEVKNMNGLGEKWPEPIVRVQSLAESNLTTLPDRYIKPPSTINHQPEAEAINIPIIDLDSLFSGNKEDIEDIDGVPRVWVLPSKNDTQVINHGVKPELMRVARGTWRSFFNLPVEAKEIYSNSPRTYEGYGSRLGVEEGATLDWNDYYFLHFLPIHLKDYSKWPSLPLNIRDVMDEYGKELVKLGGRLMKILSLKLGLKEEQLQEAFGGEDVGACIRVNYYPKCPQPEFALGLSPHSDPGGMTILLPDDQVLGLQVRYRDTWITVNPLPHVFIVNLGDQLQILSNSKYKSVVHRVMVNSEKESVLTCILL